MPRNRRACLPRITAQLFLHETRRRYRESEDDAGLADHSRRRPAFCARPAGADSRIRFVSTAAVCRWSHPPAADSQMGLGRRQPGSGCLHRRRRYRRLAPRGRDCRMGDSRADYAVQPRARVLFGCVERRARQNHSEEGTWSAHWMVGERGGPADDWCRRRADGTGCEARRNSSDRRITRRCGNAVGSRRGGLLTRRRVSWRDWRWAQHSAVTGKTESAGHRQAVPALRHDAGAPDVLRT